MKTRRFDIKYKQLQLNSSKTVSGSVPTEQTYDANSGEYAPDYQLTPCCLQPVIGIIDRDGLLVSGCVNAELADMAWHKVVGGVEDSVALVTTPKVCAITAEGSERGKLLWYVNANPQQPIVLRFRAKYLDRRTNQVYSIEQDYTITCRNATVYQPILLLSTGDRYYNPLRDADKQTIKASLRFGSKECDASKRAFVWEIKRDSGQFTAVTADDLEVTLSGNKTTVTIDRSLMGKQITLRCRAKYSADGNPASAELSDSSPYKIVNIIRRIPSFDYTFLGAVDNIEPGTKYIKPTAYISDNVGEIPNPCKELMPLWVMAPNLGGSFRDYVLKGHGMTPSLPTDLVDPTQGAIVGLDVKILEPLALWADADGTVFTDGDGVPFVFH